MSPGEHPPKPATEDLSEHKGEVWTEEGSPPPLSGIYIRPFSIKTQLFKSKCMHNLFSPGQPEANGAHYHGSPSVERAASSQLPGTTTAASNLYSSMHVHVLVYPSYILPNFAGEYPSNLTRGNSESLKKPSKMKPSFTEPSSINGVYFTKIMSHFIY